MTIDSGLDPESGGFSEILRLSCGYAGVRSQLLQCLCGWMIAVFLCRSSEIQEFRRLDFSDRGKPSNRQFSGRKRSGLVKNKGINSGCQFNITHVFNENPETGRSRK